MVPIDKILAEVATDFGVPISEIMSGDRTATVSEARLACYWLADFHDHSKASIARHLNRGDHSTIRSGICRTEQKRQQRPAFRFQLECLLWKLTPEKPSEDVLSVPQKQSRPCMTCGADFMSEGSHNRLCTPCRRNSDNGPYMVSI